MKKVSALLLAGTSYLALVSPALAQTTVNPCPDAPTTSGTAANFNPLCALKADGSLINTLIQIGFIVATLAALAFLIYGGIKWITSGGDKAAVESARNTIVAALVGLVIVFLSYLILNFVFNFFGIEFGNLIIPVLQI